jgi:hypothetical protein
LKVQLPFDDFTKTQIKFSCINCTFEHENAIFIIFDGLTRHLRRLTGYSKAAQSYLN